MDRLELIETLNGLLLSELPDLRDWAEAVPREAAAQRRLLRSLMNLRPPLPPDPRFLRLQDALLSREREERGVVDVRALPPAGADPRLILWQGDITRLNADAIVNAANSALLGCFHPCHGCVDNAIHSAAGLQLRGACKELMDAQGREEPVGRAKVTPGYNLPARYVLHTVGPYVAGELTEAHRRALASCYRACLEAAAEAGCRSVAFCCVSTGEYRFPNREAAETAVGTVRAWLETDRRVERVIFNVFKDVDAGLYRALLGGSGTAAGGPGPL